MRKAFRTVGMVLGIVVVVLGLYLAFGFGESYRGSSTYSYSFGADYYTEQYQASEAKQDKAKALQKLDKDLKALTQNAQKAESALNDIEKKFVATKKAYDSAKNNMDKKKKEYESIMM